MEISHFFVLAVLIGIAFARPRQRQSVEEALSTSRRSYAHSNAGRPNPWAWGQQSNVGLVEGLCKSVRADTSFLGTTTNTPVHFCQEGKFEELTNDGHVQEDMMLCTVDFQLVVQNCDENPCMRGNFK